MSKVIAYGAWDGSRLQASAFAAAVKSWPVGTVLKLTVDKYVGEKTPSQMGYLHVLFSIAAREMNRDSMGSGEQWTPELVKDHCKQAKLYPVVDRMLPGGEVVQITLDTRNLNLDHMRETIDRVITYFAELGIILPHPREQQAMSFRSDGR